MTEKYKEIRSVEHFDEAITVVGIKGWIFLTGSLLLFIPIIWWAFLGTIPIAVTGKCLFFDPTLPRNASQPENLEIYGFLPLFAGQSIVPGMEVACTVDSLNVGKFGMVKGTVKEVIPYPVDLTEKHMAQIPSESLKEYLLSGHTVPSILVIASPQLDPNNPTKFSWTYNRDPMIHLQSGMTGMITIILSKEKPISYVIPSTYTESDPKIGRCQGGALNFDQQSGAEAAQPERLGDAGGSKFSGCPTPAEPIFESRAV